MLLVQLHDQISEKMILQNHNYKEFTNTCEVSTFSCEFTSYELELYLSIREYCFYTTAVFQ